MTMTPREAGIQAFYADEGTTNTLQGLNAAFDAYEAAFASEMEQFESHFEGPPDAEDEPPFPHGVYEQVIK